MKNKKIDKGWENCGVVIRCIWDGQTTAGNLGFPVTFFHRVPKTLDQVWPEENNGEDANPEWPEDNNNVK